MILYRLRRCRGIEKAWLVIGFEGYALARKVLAGLRGGHRIETP